MNVPNFPLCRVCRAGDLIPISDYGDGASLLFVSDKTATDLEQLAQALHRAQLYRARGDLDGWIRADQQFELYVQLMEVVEDAFGLLGAHGGEPRNFTADTLHVILGHLAQQLGAGLLAQCDEQDGCFSDPGHENGRALHLSNHGHQFSSS